MRERPLVAGRGTVLGRAITELRPIQVNDVAADPEYSLTEARKIGGFRTVLGVPLLTGRRSNRNHYVDAQHGTTIH